MIPSDFPSEILDVPAATNPDLDQTINGSSDLQAKLRYALDRVDLLLEESLIAVCPTGYGDPRRQDFTGWSIGGHEFSLIFFAKSLLRG